MKTQGAETQSQENKKGISFVVQRPIFLPLVGATPGDVNEIADYADEGQKVEGIADVDMLERSYDECYLVQFDQEDHEFQNFMGVVFN